MSFAKEVLAVCDEIGLTPILDGSLAVFAYTLDANMEIHDVDLNCSETYFPRLQHALLKRGIDSKVTDWHVLQVRRNDLKVEFGATEHWMHGIADTHANLKIMDVKFVMVSLDGLRELYLRGLTYTAETSDGANQVKHREYKEKLRSIDWLQHPPSGNAQPC